MTTTANTATIFGGKYKVEEVANESKGSRTYLATGKRGATYGCIEEIASGRYRWLNMGRSISSVPFDLAQVNPSHIRAAIEIAAVCAHPTFEACRNSFAARVAAGEQIAEPCTVHVGALLDATP